MEAKGTIVAIGGNEDKGFRRRTMLHDREYEIDFATQGILCRMMAELNSHDSLVSVITSASEMPEKVGPKYVRAFKKLGQRNVKVLHIEDKKAADDPDLLKTIEASACVMFTGGDQFKLVYALKDTALARLIAGRYRNEAIVIGGTSAGAMALPGLMIYPGAEPMNIKMKKVPVYDALSLIQHVIIDTHFLVRGRFRRLAVAVANNPEYLGIGLEEDTGIILRHGYKIEAIGSGLVTILDARSIAEKNVSVKKDEEHEIFIENMLVHVLSNGNHFSLNR